MIEEPHLRDSSSEPPQPPAERHLTFEFRGRASEYFGIWIVNVLLSIITIGIYSAWAKVRRLRYFYGNTWLDGHNFEYHARPKQILIGRLIVGGFLILYNILLHISPAFSFIGLAVVIMLPWIINKSIRFQARTTSYRNVRFGFEGSYWRAFRVFLLWPFVIVFSLGLATPFYTRATSRYIYNNLRYGNAKFETTLPLGALYANFGLSVLVFISSTLLMIGIPTVYAIADLARIGALAPLSIWHWLVVATYPALFGAIFFYYAGTRNIIFNGLTLDGRHRFRSSFNRLGYCWLVFSDIVVTVLTLFLMRPWAAIRSWRYLTERTGMIAFTDLSEFAGQAGEDGNVVAAEYTDIEWVNIGL